MTHISVRRIYKCDHQRVEAEDTFTYILKHTP